MEYQGSKVHRISSMASWRVTRQSTPVPGSFRWIWRSNCCRKVSSMRYITCSNTNSICRALPNPTPMILTERPPIHRGCCSRSFSVPMPMASSAGGGRGDLVKLLWWDGACLCLFGKRLERGRFISHRPPKARCISLAPSFRCFWRASTGVGLVVPGNRNGRRKSLKSLAGRAVHPSTIRVNSWQDQRFFAQRHHDPPSLGGCSAGGNRTSQADHRQVAS